MYLLWQRHFYSFIHYLFIYFLLHSSFICPLFLSYGSRLTRNSDLLQRCDLAQKYDCGLVSVSEAGAFISSRIQDKHPFLSTLHSQITYCLYPSFLCLVNLSLSLSLSLSRSAFKGDYLRHFISQCQSVHLVRCSVWFALCALISMKRFKQ